MATWEERVELFVIMMNGLHNGREVVDEFYYIICRYELPKRVDREFMYDCLLAYYGAIEEYEKCSVIIKLRDTETGRPSIQDESAKEQLLLLKKLGFDFKDND
jgi:hypothetical protein